MEEGLLRRMPSWKAATLHLGYPILGIAICSVAAGPVAFVAWLVSDAIEQRSLRHAIAELQYTELLDVLVGCVAITISVVPSLALVALVTYGLGRRQRDTFALTTATGATIGSLAVIVTSSTLLSINLDPNSGMVFLMDVALIFATSAIISAIYWRVAIRPQRRKRVLEQRHYSAIRAME